MTIKLSSYRLFCPDVLFVTGGMITFSNIKLILSNLAD